MTRGTRLFKLLLFVAVSLVAILMAWLSGLTASRYDRGGFPLLWKQLGAACLALGCPPAAINYDLTAFALDALFYAAIGYGLLLILVKLVGGKIAGFLQKPI
ncbi:hypothetical protein E6H23_10600 [Candidatus Bathyarchaeota archaeon]|nr:MAG: hypothetical protein E6H23_10600 [Candidatus Bathyarchaeota archaeon]